MIHLFRRCVAFILLPALASGCAIGFDSTLFVTKSNVGLDVDTKPPTAELSIARREVVVAPAFVDGQTPPVLAGFKTGNRMLFGFDVSSIFAGGDAAWTLTEKQPQANSTAALCLPTEPKGDLRLGPLPLGQVTLPREDEIRPFVFGTDTTFGLKAAWSGMTAQFPDSLKIGFNRKEMALAPVFGRAVQGDAACPYRVQMPAFLATIEVGVDAQTPQSAEAAYRQSFATGKAATALAGEEQVKRILLSRLESAYAKGTYNPDGNSACILNWASAADKSLDSAKAGEINDWLASRGVPGQLPLFLYAQQYEAERALFISEKSITCP